MGRFSTACLLALLAVTTACGGGGGGDSSGGVTTPPLLAAFVADEPSPGSNTVAMAEGSKSGDSVTVAVNASQTTGLYAAAFEVTFDSTKLTYVGHSAGTVFEQGSHTPTYQVGNPSAGRVVAGVSRNGSVGTVNVSTPAPMIRLTFRVKEVGSFRLTFENATLFDGQAPPQPKAGITWETGVVTGQR
jgi:hypothetical protein